METNDLTISLCNYLIHSALIMIVINKLWLSNQISSLLDIFSAVVLINAFIATIDIIN